MDQNYQSHGVRYKNGSNIVRNTCVALMLSVLVVSTLRSLISSDQPIKNRSGSSKSKLVARVPKVDWNAIKAGTSGQDPDCDKAYRKGKALEAMLREECSDSEYKDFKQLAAYGWTDWRTPNIDIKSLYLGPALKALKISEDKSKWMELAQGHAGTDLGKARADQKWPGTSAYYANYFNVEQGVIVAKNNQGPVFKNSRAATKDYLPAERIVPLRHLSDVVFLGYQDACQKAGQEVTKLEHVFRHQIANDETLYVWRAIADMDNLGPKFQASQHRCINVRTQAN